MKEAGRGGGRGAAALLLVVAACAPSGERALPAAPATIESSIADSDCVELPASEVESDPLLRLAAAALRCPAPADYRLDVVDDGTRSWLVVRRGVRGVSLEEDIVYGDAPGNFPNVVDEPPPSWLLGPSGEPVGLIFPVSYQSPEATAEGFETLTRFFAYSLTGPEPELVVAAAGQAEAVQTLSAAVTN